MVSSKKRSMSPSQELDAEELFSHQMSPCKSNPITPIQSVSRTPKLRLSETKRNLYDNSDYNFRDVVINVDEYNGLQSELEHARNEMTMIRRHYENNLINQNKEIDLLGKQLEQERNVNDILKNKIKEVSTTVTNNIETNVHFDENTFIEKS
jgi:predicted RNase H-like nuclease (RuvC/YqgF family)